MSFNFDTLEPKIVKWIYKREEKENDLAEVHSFLTHRSVNHIESINLIF